MPPITLLTDFGIEDSYVAQMKGVVLGIVPDAKIVDISHAVAAGDVRGGSLLLDQAIDAFPPASVHVAVVDPGVGSARMLLAVEAGEHRFVAPDNGLLTAVLQRLRPIRAHRLTEGRYWRNPVSLTFHGRDILAPVAAHWMLGVELSRFGPPVDPAALVRAPLPEPECDGQTWVGEVVAVDHFGNLITNLPVSIIAQLPRCSTAVMIGPGAPRGIAPTIRGISRSYSEHEPGSLLALFGSSGKLEIAVNGGSAAERLRLATGACVIVRPE